MSLNLIENIGQLVTCAGGPGDAVTRLGIIENAAVAFDGANNQVHWAGADTSIPQDVLNATTKRLDAQGRVVLPGLVDSHTHLVFAGSRVAEFELRCCGASYEEIAAAGGGIVVTTSAVRAVSQEELVTQSRKRMERMLAFGVTTVEIKSGYGLDVDAELKMLRAIQELKREGRQTVVSTFLGAHVVPPEYRDGKREEYVDLVINTMLPAVSDAGLADYCDVFCEEGAFSVEESRRILLKAKELGLGIRLHAEQLHNTGATALGVELGAASVDHLEFINDDDVNALASSDTVATLLPGATLFLGQTTWPPARRLLDAGAKVSLSTDCNPGSTMTENLPLMASLGCVRMGMSPAEAILAITCVPAESLGLKDKAGVIKPGAHADFVIADIEQYETFVYHYGVNHAVGVIAGGAIAHWPQPVDDA